MVKYEINQRKMRTWRDRVLGMPVSNLSTRYGQQNQTLVIPEWRGSNLLWAK